MAKKITLQTIVTFNMNLEDGSIKPTLDSSEVHLDSPNKSIDVRGYFESGELNASGHTAIGQMIASAMAGLIMQGVQKGIYKDIDQATNNLIEDIWRHIRKTQKVG